MPSFRLTYPADIYVSVRADDRDKAAEKLAALLREVQNGIIIHFNEEQKGIYDEVLYPKSDDTGEPAAHLAELEDEYEEGELDVRYRCPECGRRWEEQSDCACDATCPNCGAEDIEAFDYKDVKAKWGKVQEAAYKDSTLCTCGHDIIFHTSHKEDKPGGGEKTVHTHCRKQDCDCKEYEVDMSAYP